MKEEDLKISEVSIIVVGAFLFLDGIFVHAIYYKYSNVGLSLLDPFINHWWIGLILMVIGVIDLLWDEEI